MSPPDVGAFLHVRVFFNGFASYMKREMKDSTLHTRFAHVWNEIVDAMREEDILSNKERSQVTAFSQSKRP